MRTAIAPGLGIEFAGCAREYASMAPEISARMAEVLAGGRVLKGPEIAIFEAELARDCGRQQAVCVGSGTDALYFAMAALGIGPGDEVLVPDISFIASASAVVRAGATPVFVDVDERCLLNLQIAEARVTSRTRALLFVQLFGGMGDPHAIEDFARRHGLQVIEDGAQAFGARFGVRACGSLGEASVLSFDPMKVLSAPGSGGAVLTDDPLVAARVRRLRYHGREDGQYVELGFNSQMPSTTAAILSLKLGHQTVWANRRRVIARHFRDNFASLPVQFPAIQPEVEHVFHKFTLRYGARDELAIWLKAAGVPTLVHYPRPFHREPLFAHQGCHSFPQADAHAAETLSLPIHAHLTDAEIEYVTDTVKGFFRSAH